MGYKLSRPPPHPLHIAPVPGRRKFDRTSYRIKTRNSYTTAKSPKTIEDGVVIEDENGLSAKASTAKQFPFSSRLGLFRFARSIKYAEGRHNNNKFSVTSILCIEKGREMKSAMC